MKLLLCVLIRACALVPVIVAAIFLAVALTQGIPEVVHWATYPADLKVLRPSFPWWEAVTAPVLCLLSALVAWALWRGGGWCLTSGSQS